MQQGGPKGTTSPLERLATLALVLLFLLALAGGIALLVRQTSPRGVEVVLPTATPVPQSLAYLTGAVARPGLYTVPPGGRVAALLALAGGATSDADLSRINMAQRLRDGDHVHIPRMGEVQPPSASPQVTASVQPGKVNINTATVKELQSLPTIGEVKAQAIVDYRERNGPFLRPEDLLKVPGIGPSTLQTIYHLITVE